ncbi:MAG TPA: PadR family transcriptional regulator [Acidobacteriota bacterium]|nr:PadR family transcriptional regulator [Acidobacteriota bacterium]
MKLLSRADEIILLSVINLEGNAYGISIRDLIHKKTGIKWSLAQIYDPLNKLTQKGFLVKYKGKSTAERGGRHKYLYEITKEGKEALMEIRKVYENIWEKVPKKALT